MPICDTDKRVFVIAYSTFSQLGTGLANNKDGVQLNCHFHQGRLCEHGELDAEQPRYFAVEGGIIGTRPASPADAC